MTHVHEDIGAYVLGALDAEDATRRVAAHLADCARSARPRTRSSPGCRRCSTSPVVTGATDEEPLPPAIEERLLDRFAREHTAEPSAQAPLAPADRVSAAERAGRRRRGGAPR